ncbi:putative regulator of the ubiquitin pathway (contains UAS and UBX domains) [Handroanthus impetiginosus]|uniref:Putative regulator of the ubiquitin pathway (Contains UAS and UBX domains) n=1 Tax=Handroanthus impetiginosus TaxID=429701 RepID=A0A2G9G8Y6_9LAMI|nr:putative regulator of the ubiquitin pathway (contains UAS and UBX domains) [Handroanthus impetiginosus]
MARPDQEAIETFMSITGASEAVAIQKLEEHRGNLNEAVNAHFNEGDRNIAQEPSLGAPQDDVMDIDDPIPAESHRAPPSLLPFARDLNPFSLLDPNFNRSIFDSGTDITSRSPFVSHPREVRQIPIEVKDGTGASGESGGSPVIEDVTETAHDHGPEVRGTVILDDDDDDDSKSIPNAPVTHLDGHGNQGGVEQSGPSAPAIVDVPDYSNDIEEEMIRAAIEASKQDAATLNQPYEHFDPSPRPVQSNEDAELARAVSLSLQTAEKEKALREGKVGAAELEAQKSASSEELGKVTSSNGRQSQVEIGSSSIQDEDEDEEELQLVRHRRRRVTSSSIDTQKDTERVEVSPPSSPQQTDNVRHSQPNGSDFPSEWGGISSEEHDEAVMLEAAMFGGIPEGSGYQFPYGPHHLQNGLDRAVDPYPSRIPRPPSPSLTAQRLLREQQDDEYFASLQADREKELKAKEEAEAALAEERRREEKVRRQLQEEQEIERQLAAKEAMPDGSRRGRRFLKSDKLQYLFDFIDVGRGVKPGSYRLVRPYPRRAFSDGEGVSTLNELGLTSKQEALYLESI